MVLLVHIGARIAYRIDEVVEERRAHKGHPGAHTTDSRTRYPYQELDPDPYHERYQPPENRLARRLERARARKRGKIAEWKKQERLKRRERAKSFGEEV